MESKMKFEFTDSDKILTTILKDSNSTSFTEFINTLESFRQEVNDYLSERIDANGVSDDTDDDDASASDEEISQPISPKKRRK